MKSNVEACRRTVADARRSLDLIDGHLATLERAEREGEPAVTVLDGAKLLVRIDALARQCEAMSDVTDGLSGQVPEPMTADGAGGAS
jgi:hypothetical protein